MIKITVTADTSAIDNLKKAIAQSNDILLEALEYANKQLSSPYLSAVKEVPSASRHPFVWSNDPNANARARRWYFAAISRGDIPTDGNRYLRSGKFGESFDIGTIEGRDGLESVFGSDFRGASYVVGNEDGTLRQIVGHERTGWWRFEPIAESWAEDTTRAVSERFPVIVERYADGI